MFNHLGNSRKTIRKGVVSGFHLVISNEKNVVFKRTFLLLILVAIASCSGSGGGSESQDATVQTPVEYFALEATAGPNGSIEPTRATVQKFGLINFVISPDDGYAIHDIHGCSGSLRNLVKVSESNTYRVSSVTESCDLTVSFKPGVYVDTTIVSRGQVEPTDKFLVSPETVDFRSEDSVYFTIVPDTGYRIADVSGCDGAITDNRYLVNNTGGDCEVSISFEKLPDLSGDWSGKWRGDHEVLGPIDGAWTAQLDQQGNDIQGDIFISGDIDCASGKFTGYIDTVKNEIKGDVIRDPCPPATWTFTTLDENTLKASGVWTHPESFGQFMGEQASTSGGPRIEYIFPPVAFGGDYVNVIGANFETNLAGFFLRLEPSGREVVPEHISESLITFKLPYTSAPPFGKKIIEGKITYESGGLLTSRQFGYLHDRMAVNTEHTQEHAIDRPLVLDMSIDGKYLYSLNKDDGSVSKLSVESGSEVLREVLYQEDTPLHFLLPDPSGKNIYIAGKDTLTVIDAHSFEILNAIDLPADNPFADNAPTLAATFDNRYLFALESIDGGSVSILDVGDNFNTLQTIQIDAGSTPRSVAIHPNNQQAFIAVSGLFNGILVYDLDQMLVTDNIEIGDSPRLVRVRLDDNRLYILNDDSDIIHQYHLVNESIRQYSPPGLQNFVDIIFARDGQDLFYLDATGLIENRSAFNQFTGVTETVSLNGFASDLLLSRDGLRLFAALPAQNKIIEVSDLRTLIVSRPESGLVTVDDGFGFDIFCGYSNKTSYFVGEDSFQNGSWGVLCKYESTIDGSYYHLELDEYDAGVFRFNGWIGDGCSGSFQLDRNRHCKANLALIPPTNPGTGGGPEIESNCFIATAAFGSPVERHVLALRKFRDEHLLTNSLGSAFVDYYYEHSPPVADFIRDKDSLRSLIQAGLVLLVFTIEHPILAFFTLLGCISLFIYLRKALKIPRLSNRFS